MRVARSRLSRRLTTGRLPMRIYDPRYARHLRLSRSVSVAKRHGGRLGMAGIERESSDSYGAARREHTAYCSSSRGSPARSRHSGSGSSRTAVRPRARTMRSTS